MSVPSDASWGPLYCPSQQATRGNSPSSMKCLISSSRCPWERPASVYKGALQSQRVGTRLERLNSWAGEEHSVLCPAGVLEPVTRRDSGGRRCPLSRSTSAVMWPSSCFLGNRAPRAVSAPVAPGRLLPFFLLSSPSLSSCHVGFLEHPPKPSDRLGPLCWHAPAWSVLLLARVCCLP